MIPPRSAPSTDDDFAPESSLLTVAVRRPRSSAKPIARDDLGGLWRRHFDPKGGIMDEASLKAALGDRWSECFLVEDKGEEDFGIRPIGRLPDNILKLIAGGDGLSALVEQINYIARQNRHSVEMIGAVVQFDDDIVETSMALTLVPLTTRNGVVTRYLGTLGQ